MTSASAQPNNAGRGESGASMEQTYEALQQRLASAGLDPSVVRRGSLEVIAATKLRQRGDSNLEEALERLARALDIQCLLLLRPHRFALPLLERMGQKVGLDSASPEQSLTFVDMLRAGDRATHGPSGLFYPPDIFVRSLAALAIADQPLLCLDCGDTTLVPRLLLHQAPSEQREIEFTTVDASPDIVSDLRLLVSLVVHDLEQVRESVTLDEEESRWDRWVDDTAPLSDASGSGLGGGKFGTILLNLLSPIYGKPRQRAELNELLPTFMSESLTSDGRAILIAPSVLLDGYGWSAFREATQKRLHVESIAELSFEGEPFSEAQAAPLVLITLRQPQQAVTRSVTDFAPSGPADPTVAPADLLDDLVVRLERREKGLPPQDGMLFERPTSELLADRWDAKFYSPARLALGLVSPVAYEQLYHVTASFA